MEDTFPLDQESVSNAKNRADAFKQEVFEYIQNANQFDTSNDAKIAVVSHSMFMKILTSKDKYWQEVFPQQEEGKKMMPSNDYSTLMMNCEFQPLMKEYL